MHVHQSCVHVQELKARMCLQATCCSEDPEELECGHYGSCAAAGVPGRAPTHVAADWHGHEADHILQVGPCYLLKLLYQPCMFHAQSIAGCTVMHCFNSCCCETARCMS